MSKRISKLSTSRRGLVLLYAAVSAAIGCTAISIQPTCPDEIRVGESGPIIANADNAGAIALFTWEVFPQDAGTITDTSAANTQFAADREGGAVLRLTASDGLYQVISQCTVQVIGELGVAVALSAEPVAGVVGEPVTLVCANNGTVPLAVVALSQESGAAVGLTEQSFGVWSFVPNQIGDVEFRCVGEDDAGNQSAPATLTLAVTQTPPNDGDNANGNENLNDNGTDNGTDNTNTNGGRTPPGRS